MSEDRLLSEEELAARWGYSVRTIKRWRKEDTTKVPPSYPLGHRGGLGHGVKYKLSEIEAFEQASKNK